jgi:hypothetical protein
LKRRGCLWIRQNVTTRSIRLARTTVGDLAFAILIATDHTPFHAASIPIVDRWQQASSGELYQRAV